MVGMSGSKIVLVSGDGVVSLDQHGRVVGLKPGNATVYTALLHTQKQGNNISFFTVPTMFLNASFILSKLT